MSESKRVSLRRPEGTNTSELRIKDDGLTYVLKFNRSGIARVKRIDAELFLKLVPSLEIIEENEDA